VAIGRHGERWRVGWIDGQRAVETDERRGCGLRREGSSDLTLAARQLAPVGVEDEVTEIIEQIINPSDSCEPRQAGGNPRQRRKIMAF